MDSTLRAVLTQLTLTMGLVLILTFSLPGWIVWILLFFLSCLFTLVLLLIGVYRKL